MTYKTKHQHQTQKLFIAYCILHYEINAMQNYGFKNNKEKNCFTKFYRGIQFGGKIFIAKLPLKVIKPF